MMLDWLTSKGYTVKFNKGGVTASKSDEVWQAPSLRGLCELLGWTP